MVSADARQFVRGSPWESFFLGFFTLLCTSMHIPVTAAPSARCLEFIPRLEQKVWQYVRGKCSHACAPYGMCPAVLHLLTNASIAGVLPAEDKDHVQTLTCAMSEQQGKRHAAVAVHRVPCCLPGSWMMDGCNPAHRKAAGPGNAGKCVTP
jgi:hypothetical protein